MNLAQFIGQLRLEADHVGPFISREAVKPATFDPEEITREHETFLPEKRVYTARGIRTAMLWRAFEARPGEWLSLLDLYTPMEPSGITKAVLAAMLSDKYKAGYLERQGEKHFYRYRMKEPQ